MMRLPRFKAFSILCLCFVTLAVDAKPAKEFSKTITKEFNISTDGVVDIKNRYGHVDLETWSGNKVKIDVTIKVDARNQDKADETFDRIDIDFSNSSTRVSAATSISTNKSWRRWFGGSSDKFQINYKVYLPASVEIDLENKYGDIYVPNMSNRATVVLKYGNLRMDNIEGDVDLTMGYAKGSLTSAGDLDVVMSYSQLRCGDLQDVVINSKYSTFEAKNAGTVRSSSGYDNYDIESLTSLNNVGKYDDIILGKVDRVDIDTKYSNVEVSDLTQSADFSTKYGGVKVHNVAAGFSFIEIAASYTGYTIEVDRNADFVLDASAKYCSIKTYDVDVYHDVKKNSEHDLKAFRGSRQASPRITAVLSYGGLTVR